MVNIVILLPNGHVEDVNLKCKSADTQKTIEKLITDKFIKTYITNFGKGKIKKINSWKIDDNQLFAFGYLNGEEDDVNNHELPPSESESKCFGDILMIKTNHKKQILTMSSEEYEKIYTSLFNNDTGINDEEDDNSEGYSDEEDYENQSEEDEDSEKEGIDEIDYEDSDNEEEEDEEKEENDSDDDEEIDLNDEIDMQKEEDVKVKNEVRIKNMKLLNNVLQDDDLTETIENSIYRFTCETCRIRKIPIRWDNIAFKKIYINKSRSLYSNLKQNSYIKNVNLLDKINNKSIDVENIGFMTSQELFPEHWKKMLDAQYKKDKFTYDSKPEAMTDQFKCGRCKSRECSYYEMQTRSADEGMTIFITCLNCGNRWKQ